MNVKAGSLTLNGSIVSAGDITLQSTSNVSDITLANTITSTGGDIVLASGRNFINSVGASVLTPGAGKTWQVWSADPSADTRNSMVYDFKQYNAAYGTTTVYLHVFLKVMATPLAASKNVTPPISERVVQHGPTLKSASPPLNLANSRKLSTTFIKQEL